MMTLEELRKYGYNSSDDDVQGIVSELCNKNYSYPIAVPTSELVLDYFLYNMQENGSNMQYCYIQPGLVPFEFNGKILRYCFNNSGERKYLFVSEELESHVNDRLIQMELGLPHDRISIDSLTSRVNGLPDEARTYIKWYLAHLGLREGSDSTVPEYKEELGNLTHSIMPATNDTVARFSSAMWFSKISEKKVLLAGLGGIGSYVALLLARSNVGELILMDDDVVEVVNMAGQLYSINDIGKSKANAVAGHIIEFSNYYNVTALPSRYTSASDANDIMICGFDNMEARKVFFENWATYVQCKPEEQRKQCLFIDGRLSADTLQIFTITGDNAEAMEDYRRHYLFSSEDADETICSYKQTSYMATMIGSLIVNMFINFVANEVMPYYAELPFFVEYTSMLADLKIRTHDH